MSNNVTRKNISGAAGPQQQFVTEGYLEQLTGIKKSTWQQHRFRGRGPQFYKLCGAIRYDLDEVMEWIKSNAVRGGARQ